MRHTRKGLNQSVSVVDVLGGPEKKVAGQTHAGGVHAGEIPTKPLKTIQASSLVLCSRTSAIVMSSLRGPPARPFRLAFCFVSLIQSIWLKPFPGFV